MTPFAFGYMMGRIIAGVILIGIIIAIIAIPIILLTRKKKQ